MNTVREVMNRYGVTEATVLGWLNSGELRGINVGREPGKKKPRWRISEAALQAFEAARSTLPAQPATPTRRLRYREEVAQFYP